MLQSRNVTRRHMERALFLENDANVRLTWPLRAKPGKVVGTQHGLREEDAGEGREGGGRAVQGVGVRGRTCVLWLRLQLGPFLQKPRA
jgi:hypothetical protein